MPKFSTPVKTLSFTITMSAASNLAASWGEIPWMIAGLAATAAVPMATHLWPSIDRDGNAPAWQRLVRFIATAIIVITAAIVTVVHTVDLLAGVVLVPSIWLALSIVISVELLAVLSALAWSTPDRPADEKPAHEPVHPGSDRADHPVDHPEPEPRKRIAGGSGQAVNPEAVAHVVHLVRTTPERADETADRIVGHLTGHLVAHGRLPSQRDTSRALDIPRTTVGRHWLDAVARVENGLTEEVAHSE